MTVKLVSITPDAEKTMAYIARVSNPNNQENEKYSGLLKYCIKHNHWSVFEQSTMTVEIETTRAIAAQILRHRSFTFQEFSQRYAVSEDFIPREARLQDPKNRQNSIPSESYEINEFWRMKQKEFIEKSKELYKWALDKGIAKEQARAVLPEGNTMTTIYMAGTLRSWIHYCKLRGGHGTQLEHTEIANRCWDIIETHFPDVVKAVDSNKDE